MAYIGGTETVSAKPTFAVELGTGLVTIPNTQSNVLHFDSAYKSFVNINVDTTTTLVTLIMNSIIPAAIISMQRITGGALLMNLRFKLKYMIGIMIPLWVLLITLHILVPPTHQLPSYHLQV